MQVFLSFFCCRLYVYRSAIILRNLPCPENSLVIVKEGNGNHIFYCVLNLLNLNTVRNNKAEDKKSVIRGICDHMENLKRKLGHFL